MAAAHWRSDFSGFVAQSQSTRLLSDEMEVRALPDPPRGMGCAFEHGTSPGSSSGRAAASEAVYAGSNPALGTATFATAEVGDSIQVILPSPLRLAGAGAVAVSGSRCWRGDRRRPRTRTLLV